MRLSDKRHSFADLEPRHTVAELSRHFGDEDERTERKARITEAKQADIRKGHVAWQQRGDSRAAGGRAYAERVARRLGVKVLTDAEAVA